LYKNNQDKSDSILRVREGNYGKDELDACVFWGTGRGCHTQYPQLCSLGDVSEKSLEPCFGITESFLSGNDSIPGILDYFSVCFRDSGCVALFCNAAQIRCGSKNGSIAGLAVWILQGLSFEAISGAFGLFPSKVLVIDAMTILVATVISTLVGAWVYKESE
jgi:hypothetical protein